MDTDPWGSSNTGDPWSTNKGSNNGDDDKPKDVLNVPKEFILARKASTDGADPWSTPSAQVDIDEDEDQVEIDSREREVMKPAWAEVDDAWATPAVVKVSEEPAETDGLSIPSADTILPHSIGFEAGFRSTPNFTSPPTVPVNLASPPLPPNDSFAIPSRPTTPAIETQGFSSSSPFYEEDASYNPFSGRTSPQRESASSPFRAESPPLPRPILGSSSPALPLPTFGSSSSLPQSPSFGDDAFGGFSSGMEMDLKRDDDAMPTWGSSNTFGGGGGGDDGWGSPTFETGGFASPVAAAAVREEEDDEEEEEGAWGGDARPAVARVASTREDDWDQARRAIERRQARAPTELVKRLEQEWKTLALDHYGARSESEKRNRGSEGDDGLDRITLAKRDELADRLTSLPAEIATFQPNVSMTITHARYQDSISSLELDTRTSLLALVSRQNATHASRRQSAQWHAEFENRSKLGEPEAEKVGGADGGQTARNSSEERGKWSFWGRRQSTQNVPLVTSGGGILEVKPITPNQTGAGIASRPGSVANTPGSVLPIVPEAGVLQSLQAASPMQRSPSVASAIPSSIAPMTTSQSPAGQPNNQSPVLEEAPAPSAVGRFFGRFRRSRQDTPSASVDLSNKDLALTQDDFSFLDQVPSSAPAKKTQSTPGVTDLLSMDANPTKGNNEQMASLEAMLSSKPVALPSRLAPHQANSRTSSTGSIPKLEQNSRSSSNIDLFADLDFGAQVLSPVQANPAGGFGGGGGLFDLMTASAAPPAVSPPAVRVAGGSSQFSFGDFDSFAGPSKPSLPPPTIPKLQQPISAPKPAAPSRSTQPVAPVSKMDDDGFGDFGDFGDYNASGSFAAPASGQGNGGNDDFGDFGDFGGFGTGSTPAKAAHAPAATSRLPAPTPRIPQSIPQMNIPAPARASEVNDFSYLDNFGSSTFKPAQALVDNAAQKKGRWPAPVSPLPDMISPPPQATNSFFPKLDPPTRSASARATPPPPSIGAASKPSTPFGFDMGGMSAPLQSASPVPTMAGTSRPTGPGQSGALSAQDLSFFDSL